MKSKSPNHDLSEMRCPVSLSDVDLFGPGSQEHWYEAYEILHNEAPVLKLAGEGFREGSDGYLLTKYSDISRVVKDPVRFKPTITVATDAVARELEAARAKGTAPQIHPAMNAMIVSMASLRPSDELYRAHKLELTDPWVGPGASRHRQMITEAADSLIDRWIERGEVEFIKEFARPLPQIVLANILGFPLSDLSRLEAWGNAQVASFVHGKGHRNILPRDELIEQGKALEEFRVYVETQVAEKRSNPKDDMISFLTTVEYQALGRKLNDVEINGIVYAMVIGGLETTQYALEEQAQLLCDDDELFGQIRGDRSKLRAFVEESLRLRSPTQGLSTRVTTQDELFQDVAVPAGSLLHLRWGAGNVDADEYECPHQVQLDRKKVGGHLAFSQGPRICPGAGISRLEQTIAWSRLLDRVDCLDYADGNKFLHQPGIMLGTLELHLKFRKAP